MESNQRIKQLRKSLKMNQQEFADSLSKTRVTVAYWESGKIKITESVALLISEKYNVNYDWLMNGNGDMFKCTNQEVIDNLNQRLDGLSEAEIEFLRKWLQLSYEERVYIFDKIKFLFGDVWAKKNTD